VRDGHQGLNLRRDAGRASGAAHACARRRASLTSAAGRRWRRGARRATRDAPSTPRRAPCATRLCARALCAEASQRGGPWRAGWDEAHRARHGGRALATRTRGPWSLGLPPARSARCARWREAVCVNTHDALYADSLHAHAPLPPTSAPRHAASRSRLAHARAVLGDEGEDSAAKALAEARVVPQPLPAPPRAISRSADQRTRNQLDCLSLNVSFLEISGPEVLLR